MVEVQRKRVAFFITELANVRVVALLEVESWEYQSGVHWTSASGSGLSGGIEQCQSEHLRFRELESHAGDDEAVWFVHETLKGGRPERIACAGNLN